MTAPSLCSHKDERFLKLVKELDLCSGLKAQECDSCPQSDRCIKQWDGISEKATLRLLTAIDYTKYKLNLLVIMRLSTK